MSTAPTAAPGSPAAPALPAPSEFARHWTLDPGVVYLNHGSFGACPRVVLEAQRRYRDQMEREAVRFFVQLLEPLMDAARRALAGFLRCRAEDLALVPNATTGVATAMANLEPGLKGGDEILMNEHEYPGCQNGVRRVAARAGAVVVRPQMPFPISSPEQAAEAILSAVTARTRIALISHITSPSGIILPVERLVRDLEQRGIAVIIDGAHAAGQAPNLDVGSLGASLYTGNCHKWLCTPKGSAFLHVRPDRQQGFRPLILSNSAEKTRPDRSQFLVEFDYVGTNDQTAYLAIPDALQFMASLVPGGWPEVIRRNHELVLHGRAAVCKALNIEPPAPEAMLGSLCTLILPAHEPARAARLAARPTRHHDALQDALVERHHIQVPVWGVPGRPGRYVRISAQLYNSPAQYDYLAAALAEELDRERSL